MNTSYRLKSNSTRTRFVLQKTDFYQHKKEKTLKDTLTPPTPRTLSLVGSDSYDRSLRRAFSRAKLLAYFNPDLTQFITFTYASNMLDENQALYDIKQFLKKEKRKYSQRKQSLAIIEKKTQAESISTELSTYPQAVPVRNRNTLTDMHQRKQEKINRRRRGCGYVDNSGEVGITHGELLSIFENNQKKKANPFKYLYVFERQKRGAIHVHMICNEVFEYQVNKNGYRELKNWPHGFTSVLTVKDFDNNFKPYLYLFKYMRKAERIGKSFIHTSRNSFDNIDWVSYDDYTYDLSQGDITYKEDYKFTYNQKDYTIIKEYFKSQEA